MKKKEKNGFTLIELLAVIVVLALIMIIAIPSVLEVIQNIKKRSFVMYVEKIVEAVEIRYNADSNLGAIRGAGVYVYDIKTDLNMNGTGDYEGYVVVDAHDVDNKIYRVTLYDKEYELENWNITTEHFPTETDIIALDGDKWDQVDACERALNEIQGNSKPSNCLNKDGLIITR